MLSRALSIKENDGIEGKKKETGFNNLKIDENTLKKGWPFQFSFGLSGLSFWNYSFLKKEKGQNYPFKKHCHK